jgi:8-oxo-dGTP pyrophosphatase MutT (NUDIX family)
MNKIYIYETAVSINQEKSKTGVQVHFEDLKHPSLPSFITNVSHISRGNGINIWGASSDEVLEYLTKNLTVQVAGGGLVQNPAGEVLFIFRKNCWDLPKGKPENGESIELTAIREVEEECGITALEIIAALPTTYHIYSVSPDEHILKICNWFHMNCFKWEDIQLQHEEDITDAKWVSMPIPQEILCNAFPSIRDLANYFQQDYLRMERRS